MAFALWVRVNGLFYTQKSGNYFLYNVHEPCESKISLILLQKIEIVASTKSPARLLDLNVKYQKFILVFKMST